jgi:uncharacterized protein
MKVECSFLVPVPPAEAWPLLLDIPTIAPCLPGAEITETIDAHHFRGRTHVRIGPVQLAFEGEAKIAEIDNSAMTARVVARGHEKKGRGNASAVVDFSLSPDPAGSKVHVVTDLSLVGTIAQYGRGVGLIRDIADQLVGQFARNLEEAIRMAAGDAGLAVPGAGQPIAGFRLLGGAMGAALKRQFGRRDKS